MNDHTRRSWVLTIGHAAVGLGIAWKAQGEVGQPAPLPPGVYLPSTDHLSHALMSGDRYHAIPPGCPTDYVQLPVGPYKPLFFSGSEFPVIRRLTQLLLGEGSGDVAVAHEVAEWIDLVVSRADAVEEGKAHLDPLHRALVIAYLGSSEERGTRENAASICRQGLNWILNVARTRYTQEFMSLSTEQQTAILQSISDERPDKQGEDPGTRFFHVLKVETANGFYTSRVGLKELNFRGNAFYAQSPGCRIKS